MKVTNPSDDLTEFLRKHIRDPKTLGFWIQAIDDSLNRYESPYTSMANSRKVLLRLEAAAKKFAELALKRPASRNPVPSFRLMNPSFMFRCKHRMLNFQQADGRITSLIPRHL